jgi:hypothetical protein
MTLLEIWGHIDRFPILRWYLVQELTTSFSVISPEDLVEDVGLIFDFSWSASTLLG